MTSSIALVEQVVRYAGDDARPRLAQAVELAERAHGDQVCQGSQIYLEHVVAVAQLLARWCAPVDVVIAGLLHDVTDRRYTVRPALDEVREVFGDHLANRIESIVRLSRLGLADIPVEEADRLIYDLEVEVTQLPGIARVLHQDPVAAAIKIADRIEKLTSRCALPVELQNTYALATMGVFVPIANRLGMWAAKRDLEDGAFELLHPDEYARTLENYGLEKRLSATESMLEAARSHLAQCGIAAEVTLMPASLYSLHRKLLQAEKAPPLHLLTPLLVLVDSTDACYAAMRAMHQLWPPFTGQVWDYIASPKSNQYRAIHTRLRYGPGGAVTTLIRSQEAHLVAERGITAGWAGVPEHLLPTPPEWRDPPANRIAVFTPNGDLKELRKGAIALDFAYAVHPLIGHQCVSALINGEPSPLERELRTGDVVEIVTSESSAGPRDEWLKKVKTRKARGEIRRWLMSQGKDVLAQQGWNLLDGKLREAGVSLTAPETASRVRAVSSELGYGTVRDLQLALALGRVTTGSVLARMQRDAQDHGTPLPHAITVPLSLAGLPRRLAKCCRPLSPDPIVGYVNQRQQVVVHRATCYQVRRLKPLLSVEWRTHPWQSAAQIQVNAEDRAGLVRDIAGAVTESGIAMSHFHADRMENGSARITLDLDQTTSQQTKVLLDRLRAMDSVRSVVWGETGPGNLPDPAHYFQIPYTLSPVMGRRFFGRTTELLKLADYLRDPMPGKAILLWGPRRIGKTSLLRHLEQMLSNSLYLPVFVDMQGISGQETSVFLHTVARMLATGVDHPNINVPKFNRMQRDPLGYFRSFVDNLRRVESRHIVLILDEFQVMVGLKETRASLADSFAYLRSLITGGSNLSFLFSGGGVLDTLTRQVGASSLLNVTHTQRVDCLSRDEARRLILSPAEHLTYDDEVVDDLIELTAGHPYYLQMICSALAACTYNSGGTRVIPGHLSVVLDDWLPDQEQQHFNHLWGTDSAIGQREQLLCKLFLTAVATGKSSETGWVYFDRVCADLRPAALQEHVMWQGLQDLTKMNALEFDNEAGYRLKVPLCQRWISATSSIGRVLREIS